MLVYHPFRLVWRIEIFTAVHVQVLHGMNTLSPEYYSRLSFYQIG